MKPQHDTPPILYRIADGEPLYLNNDDGTYSLLNYGVRWGYHYLMGTGLFTADKSECKKQGDE